MLLDLLHDPRVTVAFVALFAMFQCAAFAFGYLLVRELRHLLSDRAVLRIVREGDRRVNDRRTRGENDLRAALRLGDRHPATVHLFDQRQR